MTVLSASELGARGGTGKPEVSVASYRGTYRAVVIGHTGRGNYGHGVGTAFAGLPGVAVVAVADPDETGRRKVMEQNGTPRGYADYHEMLSREKPDLVAVGPRWLDQHEAMMVAAAESGAKAIYCEKPLARSLEEADRILAACEVNGVKLAVSHQDRAAPPPHFARRLIGEGKIGRLRMMRAYGKQDKRGAGQDLLILGTRLLDLMRFFAGDARWCHARVMQEGRDARPGDVLPAAEEGGWITGDDIVAQFGFDGGVTGTYESALSSDGGGTPYFRMELCGTAGMLALWSIPGPDVYFYPRPYFVPGIPGEWELLRPPPLPDLTPPPAGDIGFHAANQVLVSDLLAAVEEDREPVSSGRDGHAAVEMILAVYASHVQGGRIPLPLTQRSHPLESWIV